LVHMKHAAGTAYGKHQNVSQGWQHSVLIWGNLKLCLCCNKCITLCSCMRLWSVCNCGNSTGEASVTDCSTSMKVFLLERVLSFRMVHSPLHWMWRKTGNLFNP
jgi:hypothetical protein